jgi:TolA-binding protein
LETAGDSLTVDLDDGSRLELAARSRLEVLAGDSHSAAVKLKRGTVVCDLVSGPERHFSVFAAEVEVRVTGTRFTVNLNPERNHVEVSVQRGSVTVVWPSGSEPNRRLTAGERWSIDRGPAQVSAADVASIAPASAPAGSTPEANSDASPTNGLDALGDRDQGATAAPVAIESPTARTLFDQGNAARRAGDSSGAARAYQSLLTKYPHDARVGLAAFELGRLRMGPLSDIPGAIRAFQSAAVLASGSAFREDAMSHLVEAYSISSQTAACKSAREAYLKEYPKGVHVAVVGRQCGVK